ncbi:MAG: hypothetical protein GF364_03425 [Candidatus Lokiarchaeota archaeon]|nr:hypothetical protein [Candidatus Lokiarchaeota archaeon]
MIIDGDLKITSFKIKVLLCGSKESGLNELFNDVIQGKMQTRIKDTFGINMIPKYLKIEDGLQVGVNLWNIPYDKRFSPVRQTFFRGTMGSMLFFDINNQESWTAVKDWYKDIQEYSPNTKFVLVGYKFEELQNIDIKPLKTWAEQNGGSFATMEHQNLEQFNNILKKLVKNVLKAQ